MYQTLFSVQTNPLTSKREEDKTSNEKVAGTENSDHNTMGDETTTMNSQGEISSIKHKIVLEMLFIDFVILLKE